jgi:hypothetical protein
MKRLIPFDKQRQERWEHNGREYSIADLTIAPLERNGLRASDQPDSRFTAFIVSYYGSAHFELADLTDGIQVIGLYASFEEARKAIELGSPDEAEAA